ncbi:uncharacterized protein DNG_06689 [Cephalotrichum gorgonifer]|uniref:DUF1479 domain-containing protein n=1 Tax=Cephalotrichum gorgonifer TaxID=2041049 RepID=A0AAE8SWP6_9PEZI|nr:uncharacterized protein DNG_06689 [Cephalotrichum gorgonifer]
MATSTANRGAAGDNSSNKTGIAANSNLDEKPATIAMPESGVGVGVGVGSVDNMNINDIFQWKRTRSSWRQAAAAGVLGPRDSASTSTAAAAPTGRAFAPLINSHPAGSGSVMHHHTNSSAAAAAAVALAASATATPAQTAAIERPLHTLQSPGRITKIRHRSAAGSGSISSISSSTAASLKKSTAFTAALSASASSTTTPNTNVNSTTSSSTTRHSRNNSTYTPTYYRQPAKSMPTYYRHPAVKPVAAPAPPPALPPNHYHHPRDHDAAKTVFSTLDLIEMENPVLSFWGPDLVPLPSRFARIKRNLIAGHESALETAWVRLIAALRAEVEHIEGLGSHLIPSIEFSDLDDGAQTTRFGRDLKRYGVGVVRGVVPRRDADEAVADTVRYIQKNHDSKPPPLPQDPTCFDFFWTPAQIRARAHPSVLRAQRFMMGLWSATADDRLSTRYPVAYADRIRVHAGNMGSLTPSASAPGGASNGLPGPPVMGPKSADDWLSAIQSSGVIAQVDNGSLERWEPDGYQRSGTYNHIFRGHWEDYDPWEVSGRATTTTDLYNGYAACSIFRMFQGLVALSTIEPGMIRLLPSPKLVTAYFLLRPFFSPRKPPPEVRSGPEWEAFLAADNWSLDKEPNSYVHGAVPGHAQRVTELWHPHLQLRRSMITLPTLQSGDYILWHPDLAYHITSDGTGLRSPGYGRPDEVSVLVYVPAAPLTQTNALYLARQRKAFQRGQPGPDFDSAGIGLDSEAPQGSRPGEEDVAKAGGEAGLQAMGLAMFDSPEVPTPEEKEAGKMDVDAVETKSVGSSSSGGNAETEVIRLANIILFPDKTMMGFP